MSDSYGTTVCDFEMLRKSTIISAKIVVDSLPSFELDVFLMQIRLLAIVPFPSAAANL
jgi:hypothetical protein